MPEADFTIGQGDTAATLESQLLDDDLEPVNILGADVTFRMSPIGGTVLYADDAATITNGTLGLVEFTFGTAQTSDAGFYLGQWEVEYAGGEIQSFPEPGYVLIHVERQLGA